MDEIPKLTFRALPQVGPAYTPATSSVPVTCPVLLACSTVIISYMPWSFTLLIQLLLSFLLVIPTCPGWSHTSDTILHA